MIDIEVFIEELPVLYRYCEDKDQLKILKEVYFRMVDWMNEKRGFKLFSRSYLDRIKKEI